MSKRLRAYVRGAASVLDLSGQVQPRRVRSHKSATEVLAEDWRKVGGDMRRAIQGTSAHRAVTKR